LRNTLAALHRRLALRLTERLEGGRQRLASLAERRVFRKPLERLRELEQQLDGWSERLQRAMRQGLDRASQRVASAAARLEGLSPLNVLGRGYSLTWFAADQVLIRSAQGLPVGTRIVTRLRDGRLVSRVEEVQPEGPGHE
jgi:exodeoxyribonuclease VII large subunit